MNENKVAISWSKSWKSLGTACEMRWNGSTSTWPKSSALILCEYIHYALFMRSPLTRCRNFADVFKTPGKLRGKTPRTARKRDALEQRQPLTDVFAPNLQAGPTPAKNTAFYEKVTRFQIAEDGGNAIPQQRVISRSKSPQRVGLPGNTDSGYHGMTEDEMDADNTQTDADTVPSQSLEVQSVPLHENQSPPLQLKDSSDAAEPASDESFMSAKEEAASHNVSKEQLYPDLEEDNATVPDEDMEVEESVLEAHEDVASPAARELEEDVVSPAAQKLEEESEPEQAEQEQELHAETSHDPSEMSSPAQQPLARKSSFTFSSLPAREPLTAKRSIGGRNSHMDAMNRNSVFAKSVGKSFGVTLDDDEAEEEEEEQKSQNKTSAQLLHERISMLGKAKESRSSKSIPQALYPQLPENDDEDEEQAGVEDAPEPPPKDAPAIVDDEDDDWIAPSKPMQPRKAQDELDIQSAASIRPSMHQKSMSTTYVPSPSRPLAQSTSHHSKAQSVTITAPDFDSTTPAGSPTGKKHVEPMSASKKLWGAFKSARNLFASSAGSSAAAKLEAHDSPAGKRSKKQDTVEEAKNDPMVKMPGALWSETQLSQTSSRPLSTISASPSRKTRSSTESDKKQRKEMKAQQKAADDFEKAREKERLKANKAQEERAKAERVEMERQEQKAQQEAAAAALERPRTAEEEKDREDMPPPPPPKSMLPPGKLRAPTRPVRPARETAASKAKPVPVNIRVASQQAQRLGQPSSQESFTSSSSSQGPPPPPKTGLRTTSAQANARASTMPQNNSRVRALEAAARKKEQEEREKQRKAEQKRELERKRAAKAEEERRVEQEKKAEEQRKMQEMKLAAQKQAEKQAAEAKRREQQRFEQQQQRLEQQRLEQQRAEQSAAAKAKAAHELAEAIQRERAEKQAFPRGDAPGTLRQLGQRTVPDPSTRQIQPNPAKPPKRILSQEDDEPAPQRPGMQRNPTSYQQNEAKRRKTDEYDQETDQRHSVMAPPKRPSTMRKVSRSQPLNMQHPVLTCLQETLSKVPYGYSLAPPPASHHNTSMFKSTVNSQHQMQHGQRPAHPSQTVQLSNARIPFAENANPPAAQYYSQAPSQVYGNENNAQGKFKTPARQAMSKAMPKSAAKSSPMYANGDNIALPEIMTDSEDEEDEEEEATGGFRAPSWVASPALRDLLTQQQLVDPETVFGPISDLKMEEVFKGAKNQERLKRFRDRGSSAMWHETGDAVTVEEKRRDMEARERVYKEGGWSYNNRV